LHPDLSLRSEEVYGSIGYNTLEKFRVFFFFFSFPSFPLPFLLLSILFFSLFTERHRKIERGRDQMRERLRERERKEEEEENGRKS